MSCACSNVRWKKGRSANPVASSGPRSRARVGYGAGRDVGRESARSRTWPTAGKTTFRRHAVLSHRLPIVILNVLAGVASAQSVRPPHVTNTDESRSGAYTLRVASAHSDSSPSNPATKPEVCT